MSLNLQMAKGALSPSRTSALVNSRRMVKANNYSAGDSHYAYSWTRYFSSLERTWNGKRGTTTLKGRYIEIDLHNNEGKNFGMFWIQSCLDLPAYVACKLFPVRCFLLWLHGNSNFFANNFWNEKGRDKGLYTIVFLASIDTETCTCWPRELNLNLKTKSGQMT